MRLHQGATVGPYEVLSTLGAGGMGTVYLARGEQIVYSAGSAIWRIPQLGGEPTRLIDRGTTPISRATVRASSTSGIIRSGPLRPMAATQTLSQAFRGSTTASRPDRPSPRTASGSRTSVPTRDRTETSGSSPRTAERRSPARTELWSVTRDGGDARLETTLGSFRSPDRHFDVSRDGLLAWAPWSPGDHEIWSATIQ